MALKLRWRVPDRAFTLRWRLPAGQVLPPVATARLDSLPVLIGPPGERGAQGVPGPEGLGINNYDPGDFTLSFENGLI